HSGLSSSRLAAVSETGVALRHAPIRSRHSALSPSTHPASWRQGDVEGTPEGAVDAMHALTRGRRSVARRHRRARRAWGTTDRGAALMGRVAQITVRQDRLFALRWMAAVLMIAALSMISSVVLPCATLGHFDQPGVIGTIESILDSWVSLK